MKILRYLCGIALAVMPVFPAVAGSVNQPGFTTGIPVYGNFPEGLFLTLVPEYGVRGSGDTRTEFSLIAPFFFLQTPWHVAGAHVALAFSPVYVNENIAGYGHIDGLYNTFAGVQFTWPISSKWGAGFRVAGVLPGAAPSAYKFGTFELRGGATYLTDITDFTINTIYGDPVQHANPTNPNYLDLDLTYTHNIGHWQFGAVAFGSTDLNRPYGGYQIQSQFAMGPVIGYNFGPFQTQFKFTSDVVEHNMGGIDRRAWCNILIPLWVPK